MENEIILKYYENDDINFELETGNFYTFIGSLNEQIVKNLLFKEENDYITYNNKKVTKDNLSIYRRNVAFSLYELVNIYDSETVIDELAYPLENLGFKNKSMYESIMEFSNKLRLDTILNESPYNINSSKRALLNVGSALVFCPKIIIINNIFGLLDKKDKEVLINYLKSFIKTGGVVVNFTNDIEESLYGNKLIISNKEKIVISGKTISVLNEEIIMKRLGFNLPFIVQLNKYMKDYELIKNYNLSYEGLVDKIWK